MIQRRDIVGLLSCGRKSPFKLLDHR